MLLVCMTATMVIECQVHTTGSAHEQAMPSRHHSHDASGHSARVMPLPAGDIAICGLVHHLHILLVPYHARDVALCHPCFPTVHTSPQRCSLVACLSALSCACVAVTGPSALTSSVCHGIDMTSVLCLVSRDRRATCTGLRHGNAWEIPGFTLVKPYGSGLTSRIGIRVPAAQEG